MQIVPNPFEDQARIAFGLTREEEVRVGVYDLSGRLVTEIVRGTFGPGSEVVTWHGRSASGEKVSAGVYFVRVLGTETRLIEKIVLSR